MQYDESTVVFRTAFLVKGIKPKPKAVGVSFVLGIGFTLDDVTRVRTPRPRGGRRQIRFGYP